MYTKREGWIQYANSNNLITSNIIYKYVSLTNDINYKCIKFNKM